MLTGRTASLQLNFNTILQANKKKILLVRAQSHNCILSLGKKAKAKSSFQTTKATLVITEMEHSEVYHIRHFLIP